MGRGFPLMCLFAAAGRLAAGEPDPAALEGALAAIKPGAERVDALNKLCWLYIPVDAVKAKQRCDEAVALARALRYRAGIAKGLVLLGNLHFNAGEYERSLEQAQAGLALREALGDERGVAAVLGNIGNIYRAMNLPEQSLAYQGKSLERFRALYAKNPNDDDAFDIAVCLLDLAGLHKAGGRPVEAMRSYREALAIFERLRHAQSVAACLAGMSDLFLGMGEPKRAAQYAGRALAIYREKSDKAGISGVQLGLARIAAAEGNRAAAIRHLERGLQAAREISLNENVLKAYEAFARLHEQSGDYRKAYEYERRFAELKDSLLNLGTAKRITELQARYEAEKRERQIEMLSKDRKIQAGLLNRQRIILWSVAGGLLLALLFAAFIFRERRKSERLLLNILPARTARELKARGRARAMQYDAVTVMFADFTGFTAIAERLPAERLVGELDVHFRKFDEIISRHPIEKIKTIGDAYMCAGGLPAANATHPLDVVRAALEIQDWMAGRAAAAGDPPWRLRIGIHTGPVTAGVVGDKKFAYDIWGDAVNLASRMESSGEAGKINISGATRDGLRAFPEAGGLEFHPRGKIPAKNKGEIEMYFVARRADGG